MHARLAILRRQHAQSKHFKERCATNIVQIEEILAREPTRDELQKHWTKDQELCCLIMHLT